ncbi:hypothetical protein, partial [Streptomyces sp. NPDC096153]|uniref:hypothetical protein n=1 Tax=Streptomyces sp. NPDC096153 TaxID=3155548 RepID=UPI0033262E3E
MDLTDLGDQHVIGGLPLVPRLQGGFKVMVIKSMCWSRHHDDGPVARHTRNEVPVGAGDRSSRL